MRPSANHSTMTAWKKWLWTRRSAKRRVMILLSERQDFAKLSTVGFVLPADAQYDP